MAVCWTRHRFSGGTLALDTANTVVLRGSPALTFDRFEEAAEIQRFAAAASGFRRDELGQIELVVGDPAAIHGTVLKIREATDRLLRQAVADGRLAAPLMVDFLRACAEGFGQMPATPSESRRVAFEAALATSALAHLAEPVRRRIRICPNCQWLFLDRSRNRSRLWCDMAVCGNRAKARRHYRRRQEVQTEALHG